MGTAANPTILIAGLHLEAAIPLESFDVKGLKGTKSMIRRLLIFGISVCIAAPALGRTGTFIDKVDPTDIRLLNFNVNWDSIFPDNDPQNHSFRAFNKRDEFIRIVTAVNPEIVCLQEINSARDPQQIATLLDQIVPLSGGATWYAHSGSDNVIASRFALTMLATDTMPSTNRGQAMALVDLPDAAYVHDLYLMNAHFKASGGQSNINRRQQHADAIINWIRDIRSPGGAINLPANTPIMVLGDLNVYETDPAYHLTTLVTGDIVDEATYGPDLAPDWDSTTAEDALPLHNLSGPETYTWRNDAGSFAPGALDRLIFSDSAMSIGHRFVLNTQAMSPADLTATGLQANDVLLDANTGYFDHLPIVVDLRFDMIPTLDGDVTLDGIVDGRDIDLFVSMATGGPESANATRISHADFNANGSIDAGDIPDFVLAMIDG